MKYYPYAGLEASSFKPLLKSARILGALSIGGIFVTLIIAGINYLNFEPNQLPITQTAKTLTNAILIGGLSTSLLSFCISAMLVWFVSFANKKDIDITAQKPVDAEKKHSLSVSVTNYLLREPC